ncbi:HD family hydrolase [Kiloniella sp. b19]|uniref:HD family hydrolase n=1 Tax=Kiloniella sp. GXU_MW_B19 TaxID=3141326 RepID=UPI0031DBA547
MTQKPASLKNKAPARAWQRMLSGRRLDLLDPSPVDIEIEDIALGLSRVARWNGQTTGAWGYTVADHSLLVERLFRGFRPGASAQDCLIVLLHDAPEYVVGDLITPFKSAVGGDYKSLEERLIQAVHLRFGLPATISKSLKADTKRADRMAAFLEATQLAGFSEAEARKILGAPPRGMIFEELEALPPQKAGEAFLARFAELNAAVQAGLQQKQSPKRKRGS